MSHSAICFRLSAFRYDNMSYNCALCASGVSPNVVGALVPAVRASLIKGVFAFNSVKKVASTQKSLRYID
jgi:hypothetical protein